MRLRGFIDALVARDHAERAVTTVSTHDSIGGGYDATIALLRAHPNLTALFATNDLMAIGALQAAADLGRRVPDDLSVVGMTDIQLAHQFRPALTTVRFPTPLIAAHAISMALEMIEGEPPSESTRVCGTPELAVRESTAVGPQGGIGATRELKRLRRVRSDSSVHRAVARAMGAQVAATAATTCQRSIQAAMPEAQRTEARKSPSGDAFPGSPDSTRDHALLTGGLRRSRTDTVPLSRVSSRLFNIRHHISKASFSPLPPMFSADPILAKTCLEILQVSPIHPLYKKITKSFS